ncbi:MAG: hypothetical protein F2667_00775 [Actinobacteria bacterium]|uniref:Unannotated protein n=1 Tax=freshwater metagenome TaxID=449393 RepID=A0A6J6NIQ3_9ZZZZ|nr:hypothetical protein [Actinomycetota bacterium]
MGSGPVVVLVVAAGAAWESPALQLLHTRPDVVVLKRCVDVDDLLATAAAGQAEVAVTALDAHGLDQGAVEHLRRHGVRPVAIVPTKVAPEQAHLRATRIGLDALVPESRLESLAEAVLAAARAAAPPAPLLSVLGEEPASSPRGRVTVVWGAAGAPGRTTVAGAIAAELARRQTATVLIDADPYGGAVAQQLGILDEVSGLLAAARLASAGSLTEAVSSTLRQLSAHLQVVTGLPRAERWVEVRPGALEELVAALAERGRVVVDTGFSLEADLAAELSGRPGRNDLTISALGAADDVLVVGTPDPVGIARLARGLVELEELGVPGSVRVVVNRMRPTLGWSEADVLSMVQGFGRPVGLHVLPEDRPGVDRALVAGRTLVESPDSSLARAISSVVDALAPETAGAAGRIRPRRAGRARRR